MAEDIEINVKGLEALLKALKRAPAKGRIGILGDAAARSDDGSGLTNAQVGAAHEYGTSTLPVRSFLRVPLSENLSKELDKSGAFNPDVLKQIVDTATFTPWLQKVMVCAEAVVADAFDTGGNGAWPPSDMRRKKVHQTLVETQQLRNSITSDIKE